MEPQSIALPLSYSPHAPWGGQRPRGEVRMATTECTLYQNNHSMTSMLESGHRAWILSTILLT